MIVQQTSDEILNHFTESVNKLINELREIEEKNRKLNESDRTLAHKYRKKIEKWFYSNGGL